MFGELGFFWGGGSHRNHAKLKMFQKMFTQRCQTLPPPVSYSL